MPADTAVRHPRAPDSWTPTPWSLSLALPAAGVGLGRLLPQLRRPLPFLPSSTRDTAPDSDAGETRRAGSAVRRTPFERFFGDLEARAAQSQHLGVSPTALPVWRLPHIAATLTLPMPSPSGTGSTTLRVRLQRPQPAPRPVAVAATRVKSDKVPDEPAAAAAATLPGLSASPTAAFASQQVPGAMGATPSGTGTAAAGVARSGVTAPGLWAGLEAPRGAKPQAKQQLKNAAETSRAQHKARGKMRFKAFARAGAYSASLDERSARDDELATQPTTPRPGPSR